MGLYVVFASSLICIFLCNIYNFSFDISLIITTKLHLCWQKQKRPLKCSNHTEGTSRSIMWHFMHKQCAHCERRSLWVLTFLLRTSLSLLDMQIFFLTFFCLSHACTLQPPLHIISLFHFLSSLWLHSLSPYFSLQNSGIQLKMPKSVESHTIFILTYKPQAWRKKKFRMGIFFLSLFPYLDWHINIIYLTPICSYFLAIKVQGAWCSDT